MVSRLLPVLVAVLTVVTGACAARPGVPRPFPGAALPPGAIDSVEPPTALAEAPRTPEPDASLMAPALPSIITTALNFRGVPYRNGGSDPSGFDCSGFVQYVFAQAGLLLPREVRDQFHVGREVDRDDVQPGDLVFFETVSRGASHVGLAIGNGQFVHAPSSRGVVRVERYDSPYWGSRFVGARRMADATTLAGSLPRSVRSAR